MLSVTLPHFLVEHLHYTIEYHNNFLDFTDNWHKNKLLGFSIDKRNIALKK